MYNMTLSEYDRLVRQFGPQVAQSRYPFTLCYRYPAQLPEHADHVMLYQTEADRGEHARLIRGIGGRVTGASGGDTSNLTGRG